MSTTLKARKRLFLAIVSANGDVGGENQKGCSISDQEQKQRCANGGGGGCVQLRACSQSEAVDGWTEQLDCEQVVLQVQVWGG